MPEVGDYMQEALSPDWRNLVISPSGEATGLGTPYTGSNGTVSSAAGGTGGVPAATIGASVVQYQVVAAPTAVPYQFYPWGPDDGAVHFTAFKVPESGFVSIRLKLRAQDNCYVQLQSAWLVPLYEDDVQTGFQQVTQTVLVASQAIDETAWTTIEHRSAVPASVAAGATHWRPLVTVFSQDPSSAPSPAGPAAGFKVWSDEWFVPDSGASLTGVAYIDGDQTDVVWEGDPHYSSSLYVDSPPPADPDLDAPTDGDGEEITDPDSTEPPVDDIPTPEVPNPEAPVVPDAAVDDPGVRSSDARWIVSEAEDVLGWRPEYRHLCLNSDVQLEGLTMNTVDTDGVIWLVNDIEGWWTTPDPDVPDVPRAWFDGSYETRGRFQARVFTLTGTFVPRSARDVPRARDRLIRALNLVHRGGWFMTRESPNGTDTVVKGAKSWLVGQPLITTTSTSGKTSFSIPLRAPDSLKYGIKDGVPPGFNTASLLSVSGAYPERAYDRSYPWSYPEGDLGSTAITIVNEGNAVNWPLIRIAGPTNGALSIFNVETGQRMRITKKLYPGEILEIDCFTRQVTLNGTGNHRFYLEVDVDWLMLQPGPNKVYFSEETSGGERVTLDVLWRSSWIG